MSEYGYKFKGDNLYPIIEIILERKRKKIRIDALVDSGATISVFQGSIGEYLGIPIENGQRRIFQGVGGKIIGYVRFQPDSNTFVPPLSRCHTLPTCPLFIINIKYTLEHFRFHISSLLTLSAF